MILLYLFKVFACLLNELKLLILLVKSEVLWILLSLLAILFFFFSTLNLPLLSGVVDLIVYNTSLFAVFNGSELKNCLCN